jgi:uroporphyrinogen decarboxylase
VPLLVRAARGEAVSRPPAWMMRQAGRYMQVCTHVWPHTVALCRHVCVVAALRLTPRCRVPRRCVAAAQSYRDLAQRHPSFRERCVRRAAITRVCARLRTSAHALSHFRFRTRARAHTRSSETTDLIVEISLQPWRAFRPDGVILFRHALTSTHAHACTPVMHAIIIR